MCALKFKRRYTARPDDDRCCENILLKDGSGARCMRPLCGLPHISYCWQHARKRGLVIGRELISELKGIK